MRSASCAACAAAGHEDGRAQLLAVEHILHMNIKTTVTLPLNNYENAKILAAIAVTTFILIFFVKWPAKHLEPPPSYSTKIIRVMALSKPSITRRERLMEMKGESSEKYLKWWYLSNVGSISHGVDIGDALDVWVSDVDEERFGGRGYIWQVRNASKGAILIAPSQIKEHHTRLYQYALFKCYILLSISFLTTVLAIHRYRIHRISHNP